jgi:adenylate cyclase
VTRSLPGTALLGAALLLHAGLALAGLAGRGTFRMPAGQVLLLVTGFLTPLLLLPHVLDTRGLLEGFGIGDGYGGVLPRLWSVPEGWLQALLLLVVWVHGCAGLRGRLAGLQSWPLLAPWAAGAATLVPALALAGFAAAGIRAPETAPLPAAAAAWEAGATRLALAGFLGLVLLALLVNAVRRLVAAGRRIEVSYVDGPRVTGYRGMTLLEIAFANGVPHVALCGGHARCTTCRVVVERGAQNLSAPESAELAMLAEVESPPGTRLACQAVARGPVTLFRVYDVKRGRARAHASTGVERQMTVLFLDMRGFTQRVSGQLPYDVVYLLNRFFDAVIPAVTERGGRIDKYLGDGFLAIFDLPGGPGPSCRAALEAVAAIDAALTRFNAQMAQEGQPPLRIGMGLHTGNLVQGEIGAAGHAPVTIIGDAVNAAARLENMTKLLSAQVLVSRPVLEAAGVSVPAVGWQQLDLRGVQGGLQALPLRSGAELLPFLASAKASRVA